MRLFGPLYDRVLSWAKHPHAERYLGALSFAESSFFPIPPDVMLAPMCIAHRARAWRFATVTTLTSLAGGVAGYAIGYFLFEAIEPWLHSMGYWPAYLQGKEWFDTWGHWGGVCRWFFADSLQDFYDFGGRCRLEFPRLCAGLAGWKRCQILSGGRVRRRRRRADGDHDCYLYRENRLGCRCPGGCRRRLCLAQALAASQPC